MKRVLLVVFMGLTLLFTQSSYLKAQESVIEDGKTVKFDYTLTVEGQMVDTSADRGPLEYKHGAKMIVTGLEKELVGLKPGDKKVVTVTPEEGYGAVDPNAVVEFPKSKLALDEEVRVGMVLTLPTESGRQYSGVVIEVKEETFVINFNHPLAGRELVFDVEIVEVQ